ncbi:MAG: 50S ribosomal protein L11 methyltransferase [Chloroflexi bacterium]|nr:50S ribosomal protein L11 methyltransferase [Chloroflexota bacterium]
MADPAWLEVSLSVDGELAEAVAEVLARFVQGGIVIENEPILENNATNSGSTHQSPALRVYGYLKADEGLDETRLRLEESLWHLGQIQPLPKPIFKHIPEVDWMEAWKQHYHPIEIGARFLILPAWLKPPKNNKRHAIIIEPGMAFGTGTHPSTQLCIELAEKHIKSGDLIMDIGCGSGILSICAAKLGAGKIIAVDKDPLAVSLAQKNAEINNVTPNIEFGVSSIAEILAGDYSFRQAPIVMANILASVLIQLLNEGLRGLVSSEGVLILSGILEAQEPELKDILEEKRMEIEHRRQIDDWVAYAVVKAA